MRSPLLPELSPCDLEIPDLDASRKHASSSLDSRATALGFRRVELSMKNVLEFLGGISRLVIDSCQLMSDGDLARLDRELVVECGTWAAEKYHRQVALHMIGQEGGLRHGSMYADAEGRPTSIVGWMQDLCDDEIVGVVVKHCDFAAVYQLEVRVRPPDWYSSPHTLALELFRPGKSILRSVPSGHDLVGPSSPGTWVTSAILRPLGG
jgi:hypothetical protein